MIISQTSDSSLPELNFQPDQDTHESETSNTQQIITKLNARIQELEGVNNRLQGNMTVAQEANALLKEQCTDIVRKLQQIIEMNNHLQGQVNAAARETNVLLREQGISTAGRIQQLEAENTRLKAQVVQQQNQIAALSQQELPKEKGLKNPQPKTMTTRANAQNTLAGRLVPLIPQPPSGLDNTKKPVITSENKNRNKRVDKDGTQPFNKKLKQ